MRSLSFLLLSLLLLPAGCSFWGSEYKVDLILPGIPRAAGFSGEGVWRVQWISGDAGEKELRLKGPVGAGRRISLFCRKESPGVFLLHPPAGPGSFSFLPAGGYRDTGGDRTVTLRWEDGAAADLLYRAARSGMDLRSLNGLRLMKEMRETGAPNPWQLDLEALGRQLDRREMRSWYIRKRKMYELSILLPRGLWAGQYCPGPVLDQEAAGFRDIFLTEGTHLFRDAQSGGVLEIGVDSRGEWISLLVTPPDPPAAASGPVRAPVP